MIIFNDENHTASDNGINVPRVSHILEEAGFTGFAGVSPLIMKAACAFGQNAHTACSLWDNNDLDVESLDPALAPYLEAYKKFKADYHVNIIHDELKVYSKLWGFCGRLDKYAEAMQKYGIIDLKTGSSIYPATAIQTGLYEVGAKEEHKLKVQFRMCVHLKGDATYSIHGYKDKQDIQVGLAAVQTYHWKARHKLLKGDH